MKTIFAALVLSLCLCHAESSFEDTRLLFDLETEVAKVPCKIQGKIPAWLSGTLLRNGPAKFQVGKDRVDWFDGLAMLHAFEFTSEKVVYSNRFLRSKQYHLMMVEKSLNFGGFAQDPCPKVFKNQTSQFVPKEMEKIQNADVSIQTYADRFVALTEVPLPVQFDPQSLETLGVFEYQGKLSQGQWESAHPQQDPITQETINYFIRFGQKSSYVIWKMANHSAQREIIAEIPVNSPAYMHSFALTEHYVVLVEFPFIVNPLDLLLKKKPFIFNYKWTPAQGTTFYVVNRLTGQVFTVKGDPFFAFHHVNAFDQNGKIFIDIVTYPNPDVIQELIKERSLESENTKLERFTIATTDQTLSREVLFDQTVELPRISAHQTARPYRYCYAIDARFPTTLKEKPPLYKIDTVTKTDLSWSEEGCFPGEPIFVAHPTATKEDEGVVLSVVLDFAHHRSFLLILDAQDFHELARATIPHAIPVGIHGLWSGLTGK
jgi:beta,beta-carotene 9',10'-dioxygenase